MSVIWGTGKMPRFIVASSVHKYIGAGAPNSIPDCITPSDFVQEGQLAEQWMLDAASHAYSKLNEMSNVFRFTNYTVDPNRRYFNEEFPNKCGHGNTVNERVVVVYFFTNLNISDAWYGGVDAQGNRLAEYVRLGVKKTLANSYYFNDYYLLHIDRYIRMLPAMLHECEHTIGAPADHSWLQPSINSFYYKDNNNVIKFFDSQNHPYTGWAETSIGITRNYYVEDRSKIQGLYGG